MVSNAERRDISRFRRAARVVTEDDTRQNRTTEVNFATNEAGFYLAIVDETTCIGVIRVIVFFHVCPGGVGDLVNRTETLAPPIGDLHKPIEVPVQCVDGASPENRHSASLNCNQGGVWSPVIGAGCHCDPGFVVSDGGQSCTGSSNQIL